MNGSDSGLMIGWGQADITPELPAFVSGQFNARIAERVRDPVTATVLLLESVRDGEPRERVVMVSCDLSSIQAEVLEGVREHLRRELPELDPNCVFLNATHTHAGPYTAIRPRYRPDLPDDYEDTDPYGLGVKVTSAAEYVAFATRRIADAVLQAWENRAPGGVAFGLGHAVVGHNRLTAYTDGTSRMYGGTDSPRFSHPEGSADHSLHVLATYDTDARLTGLIVNLACPSQVTEHLFEISADFWHETRQELRGRFGEDLFVLAQTAPAGDQSPRDLINRAAQERMWRLADRDQRRDIGVRIADGVAAILPHIEKEIDWNPPLRHRVETVELDRRRISEADAEEAAAEAAAQRERYETLIREHEVEPEAARRDSSWYMRAAVSEAERRERDGTKIGQDADSVRRDPRWYVPISRAYRLWRRNERVVNRLRLQEEHPTIPIELHAVRLGDVAFGTNPFEFYLDYGLQIQARSRAVQTFLVQLAGPGSYLPTKRSIERGAYGAVPASTEVGPESGRTIVEWTLESIEGFWAGE